MTDAIKKVALTTPQRALIDRICADRAAGVPTAIEGDEVAVFLTPGVGAVLDGTAVPEDERRDPVLYFVEGPSAAMARGLASLRG